MNGYHQALVCIASASPCLTNPGTPQERGCKLCEALINEARDALGFQRWPAVPATPVETAPEDERMAAIVPKDGIVTEGAPIMARPIE